MSITIPFLILAVSQPAAGQGPSETSPAEEATHFDYSKSRAFPGVLSSYTSPFVPSPRLDNSRRLPALTSDGKLTLALDDAIALALENNLDIAVARYNLPIAQTDLLRAKGGGAARGAAGATVSNAIFSGELGSAESRHFRDSAALPSMIQWRSYNARAGHGCDGGCYRTGSAS
jgi:hypothetical protein